MKARNVVAEDKIFHGTCLICENLSFIPDMLDAG